MTDSLARLKVALSDHYNIDRQLGQGGMAIVYLAEDLKHDRKVALKVLRPELAAVLGADRFIQEIKTTANLQHPHVLPLFDSGEADGFLYYVMPFIDGETLRDKLSRETQLGIEEAVKITTEVADALDYAHRNNVIHRDIKPENILLHDGRPMVADFGIALAVSAAVGGRLTETGLSLGTPHYMSPEQATAEKDLTNRSDIYSLGAVLYEMLAGDPPHTGGTAQQIIMKIVTDEPRPVSELRKSVPPNVAAATAKALEKLPADRFESTGAFTQALGDPAFRSGSSDQIVSAVSDRVSHRPTLYVVAIVLLFIVAAWGWLRQNGERLPPVVQSALEPPPEARLNPSGGFALSRDGRRLVFVARDADGVGKLWVRSLADFEAQALEGTEGGHSPFWSPDGNDLGFFAEGNLKRIPASGGAVQVLAGPNPEPKGGTWNAAGRIVFVPDYRTGLFEVPATGGGVRALTELDVDASEQSHRWPQFLPDGRTILFLVQTAEAGAEDDRSRIEVLDADGTRHQILRVNSSAAYSHPGQLLFWQAGAIHARELDRAEWQLRGEPRLVAEGVGIDLSERAAFSVSDEGTLVYHLGLALPWQLEWRDQLGRLLSVAAPHGDYIDPVLSPDGDRVAYVVNNAAVWILDVTRGTQSRLTFDEVDHYSPTWSPDGEWLAYATNTEQGAGGVIYRRPSSGLGEKELLYEGTSGYAIQDITWSPDGRWIAFAEEEDVLVLDLESREVRSAVSGPGNDGLARFSPDGEWLAYTSDESGRDEVYVVSSVGGSRRWQVSKQGGFVPQWGGGGDELFFLGLNYEFRVAPFETDGEPEFGVPEPLFSVPLGGRGYTFDVAPDGRFLVRSQVSTGNDQSFKLIENWPGLLEWPNR